ncbi:MAG: oligosaccharide flippase family protein [Immundisolibacteraceae bacterium]|nr:oligosaccharide flippase family protein [Immundisolibacteraceae bacterium]
MSNSSPVKAFFLLFRTGLVSQALLLLTLPVILLKYSPANFGEFSLLITIGTVIGMVSSFKLERAIVVENEYLVATTFYLSAGLILISSAFCYATVFLVAPRLLAATSSMWVMSLTVSAYCFLIGLVQLLVHVSMRQSRSDLIGYSDLAFSGVLLALIIHRPVGDEPVNTLLGIYLVAKLVATVPFLLLNRHLYHWRNVRRQLVFSEWPVFKQYLKPVATTLLSTLQFRGIYYLLGIHFGLVATGHVALAHRVAYAPINLVGTALRRAYFSEFSRLEDNPRDIRQDIRVVLEGGTLVSLVLALIVVYLQERFAVLLPENWYAASSYIVILYPAASILVMLSWLDRLYDARGRQGTALLYEFSYTAVLYLILLASAWSVSVSTFLSLYVLVTLGYNFFWSAMTMKLLQIDQRPAMVLAAGHSTIAIFCLQF